MVTDRHAQAVWGMVGSKLCWTRRATRGTTPINTRAYYYVHRDRKDRCWDPKRPIIAPSSTPTSGRRPYCEAHFDISSRDLLMDTASHVGRQMPPSKPFSSSDATRQKSGILTPSSTASLNHEPGGAGMASRKRKRDSNPMGDLLKPTIVVKVRRCPAALLPSPCTSQ